MFYNWTIADMDKLRNLLQKTARMAPLERMAAVMVLHLEIQLDIAMVEAAKREMEKKEKGEGRNADHDP